MPNLHYYYDKRPGLHIGRNLGCELATGEILCYIDDDSIVNANWIRGVQEAFVDPDVALVGGPCLPEYETKPPEWTDYFWQETQYGRYSGTWSLVDFKDYSGPIDPSYIFGCNFCIRKKVLLEIGGFHPDAFPRDLIQYRGDGESYISREIMKRGYLTVFSQQVNIRHYVSIKRMEPEFFCYWAYINGITKSYYEIREQYFSRNKDESNQITIKDKITHPFNYFLKLGYISIYILKKIFMKPSKKPDPENVIKLRKKIMKSGNSGYQSHELFVNHDYALFKWIIRDHYWGDQGTIPDYEKKNFDR
jgi:GT2 family glycosyltransferase